MGIDRLDRSRRLSAWGHRTMGAWSEFVRCERFCPVTSLLLSFSLSLFLFHFLFSFFFFFFVWFGWVWCRFCVVVVCCDVSRCVVMCRCVLWCSVACSGVVAPTNMHKRGSREKNTQTLSNHPAPAGKLCTKSLDCQCFSVKNTHKPVLRRNFVEKSNGLKKFRCFFPVNVKSVCWWVGGWWW